MVPFLPPASLNASVSFVAFCPAFGAAMSIDGSSTGADYYRKTTCVALQGTFVSI